MAEYNLQLVNKLHRAGVPLLADLVIVDQDPLQDIAHTRDIRFVISKGQLLNKKRLDKLLREYIEECRN